MPYPSPSSNTKRTQKYPKAKTSHTQDKKRKRDSSVGPDVEVYRTRSSPRSQNSDHQWWLNEKGDEWEDLFSFVRMLKTKQSRRRFEMAVHYRSYSNFQFVGLSSSLFSAGSRQNNFRVSANVIKAAVDTATARIAKNKPRVFFLPSEGDFEIEERAKNLQQYLDGQFDAARVYENAQEVFRDACVFGNGALLVYSDGQQIQTEIIRVDELFVEDADAQYGCPQMIYRNHWVAKEALIARFPEKEEEIEEAQATHRGDLVFATRTTHVQIVEAWRKPSTPTGKDGRHVLALSNTCLVSEDWNKDYLPVINFSWTTPLGGFWGSGIALELEGVQLSINQIISRIQKSLNFFAVPRVFVDAQSQLTSQLVNDISVNKYSGNKPEFMTPPAMAGDIYQYLQWLYDLAFKQVGLSQMSVQSEKPAGLDSAIALRTFQDVESQRFAIVGQRWEGFFVQVGKVMIDLSKDLYTKNKSLSSKALGRGNMRRLKWNEVSLKDDQYVMRAFPTGLLPVTPEGKLASVQELISSGFMPKDVGLDQLQLPILNDWIDDETASRTNVKRCISLILNKGRYLDPDGLVNLQTAITLSQSAILKAETQEIDQDRIDMLRRFLGKCLSLQQSANQPQQQQGPAPVVGQAPVPTPAPLAVQGSGNISAPIQ